MLFERNCVLQYAEKRSENKLLWRKLLTLLHDKILDSEHVVPDTLQWANKLLLLIVADRADLGFNPVAEDFQALRGRS